MYLHYPLCRHTCSYCDFNVYSEGAVKALQPNFERLWLGGVKRDLSFLTGLARQSAPLKTLYLGGGTPSLISPPGLRELLQILGERYDLTTLEEFTIECNPESLSEEYVRFLKDIGVTRPSLGVQTFDSAQLRRLERLSTRSHIDQALEWISKFFSNFSLDLMIGIPDQSMSSLEADLEKIKIISPPHVSIYLLTVAPDHIFKTHSFIQKRLPPDETSAAMYLRVCDFLKTLGYEHYEVSNFSKPGIHSRHNSNYWDLESDYFGLGPGAHGYLRDSSRRRLRYEVHRDPKRWMSEAMIFSEAEILSDDQMRLEKIYLDLRTRRPIQGKMQSSVMSHLVQEKLMEKVDGGYIATDAGWLVMEGLAERLVSASK